MLSDRIFVISRGVLVCAGTSIFLKKQFGSGYRLVLVKRIHDMTVPAIDNLGTFFLNCLLSVIIDSVIFNQYHS